MAVSFPPNVPFDAPEFFGCRREKKDPTFSPENSMPIPSFSYTDDGRKLEEGCLVEPIQPEQLWKKTIVRTLSDQFLNKAVEEDAKNCANK
jgi:hypothetical protein